MVMLKILNYSLGMNLRQFGTNNWQVFKNQEPVKIIKITYFPPAGLSQTLFVLHGSVFHLNLWLANPGSYSFWPVFVK